LNTPLEISIISKIPIGTNCLYAKRLRNSHTKKHDLFKWNLFDQETCAFSWSAYV